MQKKAHVTVKARAGGGHAKKMPITHMVIRGAKNGFVSEIHRKNRQAINEPYQENEPEMNVHPNEDHLIDHVRTTAKAFGGEETAAEERAEAAENAGGGE